MSAIGGALSGATDLAKYVLGVTTTTTSNTSGTASSSSYANTYVSDDTDTKSNTDTYSNVATDTSSTTTNSADPSVIAALKNLATTAINNSTDPNQTQGLLTGILQTAGDAMTAIFGQQKQAGVYNSSATTSQNNDILSRAAADAAQAILGYQTTEQQIGGTALNQLLAATATSTTNTQSDQATNSQSETDTQVQDTAQTSVSGGNQSQSQSTTTSSSKTGGSVVCTWMHKNKLLSSRKYYIVTQDFLKKPLYEQDGYRATVAPLVRMLEKDHTTRISFLILWIFTARTNYVCSLYNTPGCKRSISGWLARLIVWICCFPAGLYFFLQEGKTDRKVTN